MENYSLELAGELDSVIIGRPRVERASNDAAYYSGKIMAFRVREIWIQISTLSLCNCMTLGKLLQRASGSSSAKQYSQYLPCKFVIPGSCFPITVW